MDGSGTVQQSYVYDVFGAVSQQSGSLGSEQQFAGQQTDPDGLQDLRARYYDPATGRFLSRDAWSVSDKTVYHPYVYADDNPATGADPSGHCVGVGDLDPEDPNNADCPGMINGQMAETTASSNPASGPSGTLIVIGGMLEDFSSSEVAAARMFESEGDTVILRKPPVNPTRGSDTSDLVVIPEGAPQAIQYDVYTPQAGTSVTSILNQAARKVTQVGDGGGVVIDLVNTGLSPSAFGDALARINGFIRGYNLPTPMTISDVRFINSGQ